MSARPPLGPRRPGTRPRRLVWLLAAALLFVAAALVTALQDKAPALAPRVRIPSRMEPDEWNRLARRRTLSKPPAPAEPEATIAGPPRPRDPMIAALPHAVKKAAIVLEVNALLNSPIGDLLVACFIGGESDLWSKLHGMVGIDLQKDIDRVAFVDDVMMVSGVLEHVSWPELFPGATQERLDADTVLWTPENRPFAVWKNQMVITGKNRDEVFETLARLEGRTTSSETPVLSERESYGEVYGAIAPAALTGLLGGMKDDIARLGSLARDIRLHVDASHDVGIAADIFGDDTAGLTDVSKAIGAALILGRLNAAHDGNQSLAEVLDFARVHPSNDGFQLEVALPLAFLQKHLAECAARRGAALDGGASATPSSN